MDHGFHLNIWWIYRSFREGTAFEGGQRVPCVMRGPGFSLVQITLMSTIDYCYFASIVGKSLPSGKN